MKKRLIYKKADTKRKKVFLRQLRLFSIQQMRFYYNRLIDKYVPFPVERK